MTVASQAEALLLWLILAAGLFGLIIGSFLNVVIWRVPRGESLLPASHCPRCDARITPWQNVPVLSWIALRGRCAECRSSISVRYPLIELLTAVMFALVTWWALTEFGWPGSQGGAGAAAWWLVLAAYLAVAAVSIVLTAIDLELQRLPDAIVLPSLAAITVLLAAGAILIGDMSTLVSTLVGAVALFVLYLAIALVSPRGIGGGDVKLAPLIGAALGFMGWGPLAVGTFAGFLLGALAGLILMAMRRATRKSAIPFGPCMLIGAWVGIVWGEPLSYSYLKLFGLM